MKLGGRTLAFVMQFKLQPAAGNRRRRVGVDRLLDPAIEGGCRHALVPDRVGVLDCGHQAIDALAHQTGYCDDRNAPDLRQPVIGVAAQRRDQMRLALHQIPLVDRDTTARPSRSTRSAIRKSCFSNGLRIHQHHDDLGEAHRAQRVRHRQLFQLLLDRARFRRPAVSNTRGFATASRSPPRWNPG